MGEKLRSADINILYEGSQILNHILSRYGSVKRYLEENNISVTEGTLNKRFKSKRIDSSRIKGILVTTLDIGWDELVKPVYVQIEQYADSINRNIMQYSSLREDLSLVNKLIGVCKKELEYYNEILEDKDTERDEADSCRVLLEKLIVCMAKLHRARGMIYLNCNDPGAAEVQLERAIEQLDGRAPELAAFFYSDLGVIANYIMQYDKAMNYYERVKIYLDCAKVRIDEYILFYFHFTYATTLYNIEYYKVAEKHLLECMRYADSGVNLGTIYMKLGLVNKELFNLDQSLVYYKKAAEALEDNIYCALVHNNIANLYKDMGNISAALDYIKKAFEMCDGPYVECEIILTFTLYEIQILCNQDVNFTLLFSRLKNIDKLYVNRTNIIQNLNSMINSVRRNKKRLTDLKDYIYHLTKSIKPDNNNETLIKELGYCYFKCVDYLEK